MVYVYTYRCANNKLLVIDEWVFANGYLNGCTFLLDVFSRRVCSCTLSKFSINLCFKHHTEVIKLCAAGRGGTFNKTRDAERRSLIQRHSKLSRWIVWCTTSKYNYRQSSREVRYTLLALVNAALTSSTRRDLLKALSPYLRGFERLRHFSPARKKKKKTKEIKRGKRLRVGKSYTAEVASSGVSCIWNL